MNLNVIIRSTELCNLNCQYCYVSSHSRRTARGRLPLSSLERLYDIAINSQRFSHVEFIWHGGEPLLVGFDYMRDALEAQARHTCDGVSTHNSIQTNGIQVDSKMAHLLRQHDVGVGVSIDAPPDNHEALRPTWAGAPSLDKALRGLKNLKSAGASVAAICVLTKRNAGRIREIYEFFSALQVPFKVSPCYPAEDSPRYVHQLKLSPEEYADAVCDLLDAYVADNNPAVRIIDLDDIMRSFFTGCSQDCMFAGNCHEFFGVSPGGEVYLCDFFYKDDYRIGNLASLSADTLLNNSVVDRIRLRQASRPTKCQSCEWWDVCRGGCPSVAFSVWGDAMREDYFCQSRIRLFNEVRSRLRAAESQRGGEDRAKALADHTNFIQIETEAYR